MSEHIEIIRTNKKEVNRPYFKKLTANRSLFKILCIVSYFSMTGIITLIADKINYLDNFDVDLWLVWALISVYISMFINFFGTIFLICFGFSKGISHYNLSSHNDSAVLPADGFPPSHNKSTKLD